MESVLIIVTSANKRTGFGNKTYNEQEVGLAKALLKKGLRCGIAYYGGDKEKEEDFEVGIGRIRMYLFKGRDFLKTAFFKNYESIYSQYDILLPITYDHYESYHLGMKYPKKTVVYHGTYYANFNKRYNLKCSICDRFTLPGYKRENTLFVTKNRLAADFLNKKGLNNTRVIGVGFDADQMASSKMLESDLSGKIETLKTEGYKILLYIGRIERRRNILFLLDVFERVSKEQKSKLIIIGNGSNEYRGKCRNFIEENGMQNSVIYTEKMEQKFLPQIYRQSDLFLLPTSYEIFGMVILEAMYFGTPVLTTLNGGSDILIKNEKSGYIIHELDSNVWAKKCIEILNRDNKAITELAHKTIVEDFVWDALADKFIKSFKDKLGE